QSIPLSTPTPPPARVNPNDNLLTSGNNNSTNINDTIGDRSKSMPTPLTNRHRASFSSFNPRSGFSRPMKGVSALGALITTSSATAGMTNMIQTSLTTKPTTEKSKNKRPKRPDIRPFYQTVGGFIHSPRSMSYGSTPSPRTSPFLVPIETSTLESNSMDSCASEEGNPLSCTAADGSGQSRELRKSQSIGKSGKKALKMRFRKIRKRKGSRESDDGHDEATSESDLEVNAPANRDDGSRGTGFARKLAVGLPISKTKVLNTDPSLPPPPPPPQIRTNSSQSRESPTVTIPAYAMAYGFGAVRTMPRSVVTKGNSIPGTPGVISGPSSAAPIMPSTPSGEPSKESSTTRFKEMIKRNVGLSSTSSAATTMPSSTATSPPVAGRPNYQPRGAIGDLLLSGDDQPSSKFSVSRLTGRRKKLTKIGGIGTGLVGAGLGAGVLGEMARGAVGPEGVSLDEDDDEAIYASMRENPHQHHFRAFLPHLLPPMNEGHPHGGLDPVLEEALGGQGINLKSRKKQCALVSRALAEARQFNRDPNVLVAELNPLPADFANAFSALTAPPVSTETAPAPNTAAVTGWSSMPTSSLASATATGGVNGNNTHQIPITGSMVPSATMPSTISALSGSLLTVQVTPPPPLSTSPGSIISQPKPVKLGLPDLRPLAPRSFLFKSYQHSRFHGHYVFRIKGDYIEYGKLPASLDHACSEYFREADKTYRELEHKAKLWHEERQVALMKREQEFEEVRQSDILLCEAVALAEASGNESDASNCYKCDEDITGHRSTIEKYLSMTTEASRSINLDTNSAKPILNFDAGYFPRDDSSSSFSNSDAASFSSTATTPTTSHFNASESNGNPKRRGSDPASSFTVEQSENGTTGAKIDDRSPPNISNVAEGMWEQTNCTREHARLEEMQRVIDNAYWQKVERKHYEDSRQQLHGLYLYLSNLTKKVEYERYEKTCDIEILKANKDATLFAIVNGDKTNAMWLESPSFKQKDEFLNWIAICLMSRENKFIRTTELKDSKTYLDAPFLQDSKKRERDMNKENVDYMIDIADTQLTLLQEKLQAKRIETQQTMRELEVTLGKLGGLDENAKKLAAAMGRALDTSQVRDAMQPSPVTGLTLAETVECKIRDVNERIVVCARIMNAARLNLNRLEYEIELEQRSIRLIRQYKIGIAVVAILVIGFLWLLYDRRNAIAMNLFKPPMSSVPLSPLEAASMDLKSEPVSEAGLTPLSPRSFEV
ncbi:hypothetical protein BGX26_004373, partial [Mortierella sp. AD094]